MSRVSVDLLQHSKSRCDHCGKAKDGQGIVSTSTSTSVAEVDFGGIKEVSDPHDTKRKRVTLEW